MARSASQVRVFWYGLTIFLSSAVLLVLEITAGRLIAPYVGVSIYSWTSIIGVILAGLSLGNWLGGSWADRGGNERSTGIALALAGVFSLFSLLSLTLIAPVLQNSELNLVSASFLYVLSMFFIPSVLLGIPTPLLTTLALALDARAGHVVGKMHALAALGSIIGTFITGFVLIQYFGSRNIVIGSALLLFILAIPFFRGAGRVVPISIVVAAVTVSGLTWVREGFASPCQRESNYFCLRVVDVSELAPYGEARALILDHLMHGVNHQQDPALLISPYVQLMDELVLGHFDQQQLSTLRYFFAGGGSYTQPRAVIERFPQAQVVVAELDSTVTDMVREQLFVSTARMQLYHRDARTVLNKMQHDSFDVIITDAFHDIAIPYHLVTLEFIQLVKSRLSEHGLFATNVVDSFPDAKLVKTLVKTLQQEFDQVDVWVDHIPRGQARLTYVVTASRYKQQPNLLQSSQGMERQWLRINEPLFATGQPLDAFPIFTDDFVPVERMISGLLFTSEGL